MAWGIIGLDLTEISSCHTVKQQMANFSHAIFDQEDIPQIFTLNSCSCFFWTWITFFNFGEKICLKFYIIVSLRDRSFHFGCEKINVVPREALNKARKRESDVSLCENSIFMTKKQIALTPSDSKYMHRVTIIQPKKILQEIHFR